MFDVEKISDGYLTKDAIKQMIHKCVDLSKYPLIHEQVTHDYLIIKSYGTKEQSELVYSSVAEDIDYLPIIFFLEIFGGNLFIGIGYKGDVAGKIFYYDMDFGLFELDSSAATFASKLCEYEGPFPWE